MGRGPRAARFANESPRSPAISPRTSVLLPAGTYVCLSVSDEGDGIAPEHLSRIFDPFFTTKGELGTGLGLPVVLGLTRACGGDVAVESQIGLGTRFKIYLPLLPLHAVRHVQAMTAV